MANGKVCTGFSKPYVALYSAAAGTVTYTGGMPLARGVEVAMDIEAADDNNFYADNVQAERANATFQSGTVTLTVDGLKQAARKLIMGLTATESITVGESTVNVDVYDDTQNIPYVGVGFLVRYMEDGVTTWAPYVLTKCSFTQTGVDAATQEEEIDWQTQELEASIMRDDSATHRWQLLADDQTTEAQAEAVLKAMLSITDGAASNTAGTTSTRASSSKS